MLNCALRRGIPVFPAPPQDVRDGGSGTAHVFAFAISTIGQTNRRWVVCLSGVGFFLFVFVRLFFPCPHQASVPARSRSPALFSGLLQLAHPWPAGRGSLRRRSPPLPQKQQPGPLSPAAAACGARHGGT